jgi:hypothetical protein
MSGGIKIFKTFSRLVSTLCVTFKWLTTDPNGDVRVQGIQHSDFIHAGNFLTARATVRFL